MKRTCAMCGAADRDARGRCKPCRARIERERYAANLVEARAYAARKKRARGAADPTFHRDASRRKRYALQREAAAALLRAQGGVCPICRTKNPTCVDHDHATGRVRGILCRACNAGLGLLREDPTIMRAAVEYLRRFR